MLSDWSKYAHLANIQNTSFDTEKLASIRQAAAQNPSLIFENTVVNLMGEEPRLTVSEAISLTNAHFCRTYGSPPR
jgi:hypothetical protein